MYFSVNNKTMAGPQRDSEYECNAAEIFIQKGKISSRYLFDENNFLKIICFNLQIMTFSLLSISLSLFHIFSLSQNNLLCTKFYDE